MKKTLIAAAATLAMSASAFAAPMYINVGTNTFDSSALIGPGPFPGVRPFDANSTTGAFLEFGFSQILATSIYDFSDGSVFGSFYDTNIPSELAAANIPFVGTNILGGTLDGALNNTSLVLPNCPAGQCDIDALSPLVPPLDSDNEGFLQTWDLQVRYHFDGVLTAAGPQYTGGTFEVTFNDRTAANADFLAFTGKLIGSTINLANLDLVFEITFAKPGFLFVDDGSGNFRDASTAYTRLFLDTNVNPPIPVPTQLALVVDDNGNPNVIRQSTLDGSITAEIPEPASLALLGLGLAGLGFSRRRKT